MWSNWGESAKASLTQALEKTGDVLSKAATQAVHHQQPPSNTTGTTGADKDTANDTGATTNVASSTATNAAAINITEKRQEILGNLQAGWSSVVNTTKASITKAQELAEEQQSRIQERINEARAVNYKRDPALPLDVVALKDAQVVYLTDRLISLSHPAMASSSNGEITGERKLAAVGHLLQKRHQGRFMVWNISEVDYETRILDEQVLTFSFPGSPSPPLGLLLKLLISLEAWLKADDRNVAVVHCLTGKGRTSLVLAAFLCWMGQAGFGDIVQALRYIAACKQLPLEQLVIPSQKRYASYFQNMLDGVRPSQPPLLLKRILLSTAPRYAKGPPRGDKKKSSGKDADEGINKGDAQPGNGDEEEDPTQLLGCAPYLQIFKAGTLLHTAPASLHYSQNDNELPFCQVADGAVSFHINQVVQGDILIRCRHLTATTKKRISMFRAALHTGYVPPKVLRLKKSELDGACNDDRFVDEFFIDLIFEPVDAAQASQILAEAASQQSSESEKDSKEAAAAAAKPGDSQAAQALAGGGATVTASAYDSMLHRDSRFWDVIAARRQEHSKLNTQPDNTTDDSNAKTNQNDPMWGPTIGRRRDFETPHKSQVKNTQETAAKQEKKTALETFSIGGELDFIQTEEEEEAAVNAARLQAQNQPKPAEPPKKDSLMEALMGALSEEQQHTASDNPDDVECVVFEEESIAASSQAENSMADKSAEGLSTGGTGTPVEEKVVPNTAAAAADDLDEDVAALLADANLDLDEDMDTILKDAGGADLLDADLLAFGDGDDDDLEDFENFLSS